MQKVLRHLHSYRLFEFSKALNLIHEITTIDKLHDKVESILKNNVTDIKQISDSDF